ncbi:MAG: hypothetical protein HN855_09155 [Anaerolineae bacterium]|jgi:hypothetical protein|nr:hypothetical protein [Anaerolineae bacterium]MBT7070241.1 hypothetical protein [Anaerolineae bacterium]MBT7325313.1 hypothetical protein [Anaerolineae bacterium]
MNNTFVDLLPFAIIYITLYWVIIPRINGKWPRIGMALFLLIPASILAANSGAIFGKIVYYFSNLFSTQ